MSWGISGPWWILSAIVLSNLVRAQLYISSEKGETTLWYNSSSSQTATYLFNCYDFEPFLQSKQSIQKASRYARGASWVDPTVYLCVTSTYWGKSCKSWGAVGWNTVMNGDISLQRLPRAKINTANLYRPGYTFLDA